MFYRFISPFILLLTLVDCLPGIFFKRLITALFPVLSILLVHCCSYRGPLQEQLALIYFGSRYIVVLFPVNSRYLHNIVRLVNAFGSFFVFMN